MPIRYHFVVKVCVTFPLAALLPNYFSWLRFDTPPSFIYENITLFYDLTWLTFFSFFFQSPPCHVQLSCAEIELKGKESFHRGQCQPASGGQQRSIYIKNIVKRVLSQERFNMRGAGWKHVRICVQLVDEVLMKMALGVTTIQYGKRCPI